MPRHARPGELVCRCSAYKFPHRFGGGRCHGISVVEEQWYAHYGTRECQECMLLDKDTITCQVIEGQERVSECPVWREHVGYNEVRLLGPYWKGTKI